MLLLSCVYFQMYLMGNSFQILFILFWPIEIGSHRKKEQRPEIKRDGESDREWKDIQFKYKMTVSIVKCRVHFQGDGSCK